MPTPSTPLAPPHRETIGIPAAGVMLTGDVAVPRSATALVIFAHGSGSSRLSSRNRFVAGELQRAGFATLLFDLLTRDEEARDIGTAEYRFDIPLLAGRLGDATLWAARQGAAAGLPIGYFGASTGAAAALIAAAAAPERVAAVVSRGGRPDLAGEYLRQVRAPTLLIVGELDREVIALNAVARRQLQAPCDLAIVPGATHLFEEAGALEEVASLAGDWFARYLPASHPARAP